jgi:polysaccharide biosynthesis/export protein
MTLPLRLILLSGLSLSMAACTSVQGARPVAQIPTIQTQDYRITAGDTLDVKFFNFPTLDDNVTVRPDGKISLRLVDDVAAEGLTPQELDAELTKRFTAKLNEDPELSVILRSFENQRIYVSGEVAQPGELTLRNKLTVMQAVTAAGGTKSSASHSIYIIRKSEKDNAANLYRVSMDDGDLHDNTAGGALTALQPLDIVYVPRSGIARADLFVDQHIRQLLMFNGFSAGVSGVYELNNKDTQINP